MKKNTKILIWGLVIMLVLNIADIATTFWNDPTLKSEVNPLFVKYSLGPVGLILILISYQVIYSLLLVYQTLYFKGYDFDTPKKSFSDFIMRIIGVVKNKNQTSINTLISSSKHFLNLIAVFSFWDYCIGKTIIIIHNSFLAYLNNNSTFKRNVLNNKVDIYLNDNKIWDTFVGECILKYNAFTIAEGNKYFSHLYYIEWLMLTFVMLTFLISKYKLYKRNPIETKV